MNQPKSEKGFTLLEVLVTMVIFSISMLGAQAMLMHRYNSDNFAKKMTIADNLAVELMESIRGIPYYKSTAASTHTCATLADTTIVDCLRPDNLDTTAMLSPYDILTSDSGFSKVNNLFIQRIITITAETPQANMKRITIAVRWKTQESDTDYKTIQYVTLRDRGVK